MAIKHFFLACSLFPVIAFAQAPQFTIQDLGALPNLLACSATGLSQSGDVTGYCGPGISLLTAPTTHGFLYSKGVLTDLNLNNQPTPLPMAVNDSGVVTGAFLDIDLRDFTGTGTPFIDQSGTISQPQGNMQSVLPFGLNNAGQLVGTRVEVSAAKVNLFINSEAVLDAVPSGDITVLPTPTGSGAAAFGVNSNGTIVGASIADGGALISPLLWQNSASQPQALPLLSGYQQAAATAVNDSGVAAGVAFSINFTEVADPLAQAHAVLFNTDGSITDLGVLPTDNSSIAMGINNSGWVVGFSNSNGPDFTLQLAADFYPASSTYHAFLYANGKMYNLNALLQNGTGWSLSFATAINNNGQIAGTGFIQGQQHGFLLTPVAGPSITNVVGAGFSTPAVTSISPNGLFTIFGSELASTSAALTQSDIVDNQLPTNLAGTCVESGQTKWGLFFVSPGQVNVLAGDLPESGTVPLTVVTNCGTANEVATAVTNVQVAAVSPEFLYFLENKNGQNPIAAIEPNGAYVGTPGLIAGATFTPAKAGDVLTAFGVGWGPTTSSQPVGSVATAAATLTSHYSLTLGGTPVTVAYAGLSPSYAGLYQVDFTVPPGLSPGNLPLVLTVDGVSTSPTAYIAVGN